MDLNIWPVDDSTCPGAKSPNFPQPQKSSRETLGCVQKFAIVAYLCEMANVFLGT